MKIFLIGLVILSTVSVYADINCGQTWSKRDRFYMDGKDGMTDIEVLVPEHAEKYVSKHFKNNLTSGCLNGKFVNVGGKEVFVAIDIKY